MYRQASRPNTSAMEIDGTTLSAIVVAVGGVVVTIFTGFFQWKSGKEKTAIDANTAVINGFILLLAEFKERVEQLEKDNRSCSRHIIRLERALREADIPVPANNEEPK